MSCPIAPDAQENSWDPTQGRPGGWQVASPPPVPEVPALLLPLTISQPSSFLKLTGSTGSKTRHVCPNLRKIITLGLFLASVFDAQTLMAEYQQPKNAPTLLASLLLSPILNTHHFLLKLFQLLNWFQNEYTLNTRWLQLNGSFTKVILLKIC